MTARCFDPRRTPRAPRVTTPVAWRLMHALLRGQPLDMTRHIHPGSVHVHVEDMTWFVRRWVLLAPECPPDPARLRATAGSGGHATLDLFYTLSQHLENKVQGAHDHDDHPDTTRFARHRSRPARPCAQPGRRAPARERLAA